jgi:integrase
VQIPTKEKLQMLIAYARRGLALKLRISRHGLRPIEVVTLRAKDIDTEHNLITPETAKGGIPRIIKIERELSETLRYEIISRQLNPTDYLFESKAKTDIERSHYYSKSYMAMRKRLSKQMNDPTIQKIKLYDFRHYDGTMFYLDCRDVPTTAHHLGHTDWKNTQIYVDLAKVLETGEDGEKYIVKVAHTDEEEMQLIENNFTFVNKRENPYTAFYRKRK